MRGTSVLLLCLLFTWLCLTLPVGAQTWLRDLDAATATAKAEGKKVLVDFTADWCGWCVKLRNEVFRTDAFRELASGSFVLLRINADAEATKSVVDRFGIQGYPTVVILDAEGQERHRITGFKPPEAYLEELKSVK